MEDEDYWDYWEGADDWVDRNLELPPEFITNFSPGQLETYQKACILFNNPKLEISLRDVDGFSDSCSLWYYGTGDLTPFWRLFDILEKQRR